MLPGLSIAAHPSFMEHLSKPLWQAAAGRTRVNA
jgi:hypothetical protein